ncbi:MAG: dephospho-CoA kinase [Nocardioidaceae bacterium]
MLRVGLTGGIGAGKSEVSRRLAELGAVVIDADLLAREVVGPGTSGLDEVVQHFGTGVLGRRGDLDRAALAARVFDDPGERRVLESIIHPRVRSRAAEIEAAADRDAVVVHTIPLLVETGQAGSFDVVVAVEAPRSERLDRLMRDRGMTEEQAQSRIDSQASARQRVEAADVVIDNTGGLDALRARVDQVWNDLSLKAGNPSSGG